MWSSFRRRAASILGDATGDASDAIRSVAKGGRSELKKQAGKAMQAGLRRKTEAQGMAARGNEGIRRAASERAAEAANSLRRKSLDAADRASAGATAVGEEIRQKSLDAASRATARATAAGDIAAKNAPRLAEAATAVASKAAKETKRTLATELRETKDKALRWLWWWSLAAVGVYAFASSVPRELIRYYFKERMIEGEQSEKRKEPASS